MGPLPEPLFAPEPEKPKRDRSARNARNASLPLESDIQKEIIEYLNQHSNVRAVSRINSGVMQEGDRFIRMNTTYGKQNGLRMRMPDIQAIHWPSGRLIAIEVKRTNWLQPSGTREYEQAGYIECVQLAGGIAFFATSLQDVKDRLP